MEFSKPLPKSYDARFMQETCLGRSGVFFDLGVTDLNSSYYRLLCMTFNFGQRSNDEHEIGAHLQRLRQQSRAAHKALHLINISEQSGSIKCQAAVHLSHQDTHHKR